MSSIVKLSISGVRAFDNHDREVIGFKKPLTLIAGPNGVGKTTIIECLRYATTGDLPPNSKGGAFIHDPKMSGEREVLAQVKLAYYSTDGTQMVCTRSMQLTMKKTTQTFKTLEGQLLAISDGQRHTISSRCADLDMQVPLSLGVSAPVLNYVIFCHQEDSLWPLAEPSVVKKRFDDIFEATKFTKALDNLKTLRKDYMADIKLQEKTVLYMKHDRERAEKMSTRINELETTIAEYTAECDSWKDQMTSTTKQLDRLFHMAQQFREVIAEIKEARKSKENIEQSLARVQTDLTVLDTSTEEIEAELAAFGSTEAELETLGNELKAEKTSHLRQLEETRQLLSRTQLRRGKLETEKDATDQKRALLVSLEQQIDTQFGLEGEGLAGQLAELLANREQEHDRIKSKYRERENDIDVSLKQILGQKIRVEQQINSAKDELRASETEIERLTRELDRHKTETVDHNLEYHESLLADYKNNFQEAKTAFSAFSNGGNVESAKQKVYSLQAQIDSAQRALGQATTRFNNQSRLIFLKDEVSKKREQLNRLKNSLASKFDELVGRSLNPTTLEADYARALAQLEANKADATSLLNSVSTINTNTVTRLNRALEDQKLLETQMGAMKQEIEKVLDGPVDSYETVLKEVEEDLDVAMQNAEQSSFTTQYYEAAKEMASGKHICLLCQHKKDPAELEQFLTILQNKISALPISKADAEKSLEEVRQEAENLRKLAPQVSRYQAIAHDELGSAVDTVRLLQAEQRECQEKLDDGQAQFKHESDRYSALEAIQSQVNDLARLHVECTRLDQEVRDAQATSGTTGDFETPKQLQDRLEDLTDDKAIAERQYQKTQDRLNTLDKEVSRWSGLITQKQLDMKSLELRERDFKDKQIRVDELKAKRNDAEAALPGLDTTLKTVSADLDAEQARLSAAKVEAAKAEKELSAQLSQIKEAASEHKKLSQDISLFEKRYGSDGLRKVVQECDECETEISRIDALVRETDERVAASERKVANLRGHKRVLQDNLQLRTLATELENVTKHIAELDSQNAEEARSRYEQETNELQSVYAEVSSNHASRLGEIKQMQDQQRQLNSELESDYSTIADDFKTATVRLESTSMATDDLSKYSKALDAAIMQYHSVKMEEVNRVLDELWKKTYKGTDVDTILIKSDGDGKGNRNYNYRVCMVKQDTELDMRGRCSAGQKVLASVIIRLALSECFGVNCGMIVLDEPTTNLDKDNIKSLATSLSSIIEHRRAQRNFQLIVITHDEEFLSHMNASAYCDHFYRLERDIRQMSRIEKVPITQLES